MRGRMPVQWLTLGLVLTGASSALAQSAAPRPEGDAADEGAGSPEAPDAEAPDAEDSRPSDPDVGGGGREDEGRAAGEAADGSRADGPAEEGLGASGGAEAAPATGGGDAPEGRGEEVAGEPPQASDALDDPPPPPGAQQAQAGMGPYVPADQDAREPPDAEPGGLEERIGAEDALSASPRALLGERLGFWLETGVSADGTDGAEVVAWATELGVRFRVAEGVVADASWGWTVASTDVAGSGIVGGEPTPFEASVLRFEPGNPVLSGAFEQAVARDLYVRVGLGVAVPTAGRPEPGNDAASLAERDASELAHRAAMAMRGWWSPWRWAPERFSLFVPARLAARADIVRVDAEAGLGVMFPVLGDRGPDPDVILQLAGGFGVEAAGPLHLGVRLRVVGGALGVVLPDAVLSAEPWARLAFDRAHLGLRGVVNLTGADRVASDRGPSWSVLLGGGGAL